LRTSQELGVRWAETNRPAAPEEELHRPYLEKHGRLPKYTTGDWVKGVRISACMRCTCAYYGEHPILPIMLLHRKLSVHGSTALPVPIIFGCVESSGLRTGYLTCEVLDARSSRTTGGLIALSATASWLTSNVGAAPGRSLPAT